MRRLLLLISVIGTLAVLPSSASAANVVELGATNPTPAASCPDNCQAIGRVSGYQVQQGQVRNPFRVKERGKIVAFTLTLGAPRQDQIDFFNGLFGGPPAVRLIVLREGTKRRHRVTGRSQLIPVQDYFGATSTFALERPLTVKKGYVVAISVPTWIPAFSVGLGNDEAWRSSRESDKCDDVRQDAAQSERGSLKTYGCFYRTARLLYTATMVPDPKRTTGPKGAPQPETPAPAPTP
jgi:hypothetical protein